MKKVKIYTNSKKQILDITEIIEKNLSSSGLLNIFVTHTTCSITTADLDPGTDLDMLDAFDKLIPKLKFRHPHDPEHVSDHISSSIIGSSLTIPFKNGKIILGTWQRIVLVELNGPRERKLIINKI